MTHGLAVAKAFGSSANLGPGFDVFGLSINKYADLVEAKKTEKRSIMIRVDGPHDGIPLVASKNSAGPPAIELLRLAHVKKGLQIRIEKHVPTGLGLGSSGATAAACAKAVHDLLDMSLTDEELVRVASLGEAAATGTPHMDNVGASLMGGFTIVYGHDPARVVTTKPPPELRIVVVTPRVQLPGAKTKLARKLVPKTIEISKAVRNIGSASALALGFAKGDIELIGKGMNDEIAEPHRETFIPGYRAVKEAGLEAGAAGVAISGAGPSVIALVDKGRRDPEAVAKRIVLEFAIHNVESSSFITRSSVGARIIQRA